MRFNYNNICSFNEELVKVHIKHMIYVEQEIIGIITIINDDQRVGIKIREYEIFLFLNELKKIDYGDNYFKLIGDLMTIEVDK